MLIGFIILILQVIILNGNKKIIEELKDLDLKLELLIDRSEEDNGNENKV